MNASFKFAASGIVGVDRAAEAIRGVAIMQTGQIRDIDGRKLFVDDKTMQQYVALASGEDGRLRARYTHGDATDEGLGTYLGRWANFRIDGDKVRQDLTLSPRSHESPQGDLGKYVLDMAESDPDMIGASMQVKFDLPAMRREARSDGFMPIRLKSVFGADIVDTPALVSGMFAAGHSKGESVMSEEANQGGITQEQFEAGLKTALESFAPTITESILSKVDERFAASKKADEEKGDEPTAAELEARGAKRASEIMAFAATAGLADHEKLAQDAIAAGQSVELFKATLADRLVAQNKLTKDAGNGDPDPHEKFRAEYRKDIEVFNRMGVVDEDAYVRTRCRDEGIYVPPIKKAS